MSKPTWPQAAVIIAGIAAVLAAYLYTGKIGGVTTAILAIAGGAAGWKHLGGKA